MTDTDLVGALEDLARRLPAPPPVTFDEVASRVRRRARRPWTTEVAVAAATVGAVAVLTLRPDPAPPPIIDATPPTVPTPRESTSPPPFEAPPITVLIDPSTVPASGATVALVVLNRSDEPFAYGLGGQLERWTGGRWEHVAEFGGSLTLWPRAGGLHDPDEDVADLLIALSAEPHGSGPVEWLTLPALEPGSYRVVRPYQAAMGVPWVPGVFEVLEGGDAPSFGVGAATALWVRPAAIAPGTAQLRFFRVDHERTEPPTSTAPTVALDRWVDGDWQRIAELEVDQDPAEPLGHTFDRGVEVPALEPGSYRLVQTTEEGPAEGYFWVTELLER